jgi:hypothetical protein
MSATHWIIRVGDGIHFNSSAKYHIWGVNSLTDSSIKYLLRNINENDILWFLVNVKAGGKFVGVAIYKSHNKREIGPLIAITKTDEELGWISSKGSWDTEIHYYNLFDISECNINYVTKIRSTAFRYDKEFMPNLPKHFNNIIRYSTVRIVLLEKKQTYNVTHTYGGAGSALLS